MSLNAELAAAPAFTQERAAVPFGRWRLSSGIAVVFLYVLLSPLGSYRLHGLVGAWLLFGAWAILVFHPGAERLANFRSELRYRRREVLALCVWAGVIMVNAVAGRGYTGRLHVMGAVTILAVVTVEIYYTSRRMSMHSRITGALLTILALEVARSLPVLWTVEMLPRRIMFEGAMSPLWIYAMNASVGEYAFYTTCALLLPIMTARAIAGAGRKRLFALASVVITACAIVLATFAGAILLSVIGFVLLAILSMRRGTMMRSLLVVGSLCAVAVIGWGYLLGDSDQARYFVDKVDRQIVGIERYGLARGDSTLRVPLWQTSLDSIREYPLFGVGPSTGQMNPNLYTLVGGHSSWLDTPAEYGLVGFACLVLYVALATRRLFATAAVNSRDRILLGARKASCALFLVAGSYNPVVFQIPVMMAFTFVIIGGVTARPDFEDLRAE